MAKQLRYSGEFLSRKGVVWRAEIWQDSALPFEVGELTFEGDEALVIEWPHSEKEEVICGSTATLRIESPGDRTYEDLFSIKTCEIQLRVYREDVLYWTGCLDPEFYEEPYERAANYEVSLTFSDFGVLDRLKYDMAGMKTLDEILTDALARIGLSGYDESYISTGLTPGGAPLSLSDLKMRSDNFYDEDGEASTLKEVLEGIFQPLALKMVQRAGKVYIYDLNALYNNAPRLEAVWNGDSQTLGTDVVYNNAKITWNTYAQADDLLPDDCWPEDIETDENEANINNQEPRTVNGCQIWTYHLSTDPDDLQDTTDTGFTLWTTDSSDNVPSKGSRMKIFKTVRQFDGSETEGVAFHWPGVGFDADKIKNDPKEFGIPVSEMNGTSNYKGLDGFTTQKTWLPPVMDTGKLCLRVTMDMLLDVRYNYHEGAVRWRHDDNQLEDYDMFEYIANFVYIPVTIYFKPDGTDDLYVWKNSDIVGNDPTNTITQLRTLASTMGRWYRTTDVANSSAPTGYLAYYEKNERDSKSGALGWKTNRPAINPHTERLQSLLMNCEDGQYIPFPPSREGGQLWITVHSAWLLATRGYPISQGATDPGTHIGYSEHLWSRVHWAMCKLPQVEIMNYRDLTSSIDTDDVEYSAEIHPDAKEDIEIDTICGTAADGVPTSRGAYFNAETGRQITEFTRAGRTTQAENLLCGTLFSQFGQRHTKLSGEMELTAHPLSVYTEQNQGEKIFMLTQDSQDVIEDTSDAAITELRPDEYEEKS